MKAINTYVQTYEQVRKRSFGSTHAINTYVQTYEQVRKRRSFGSTHDMNIPNPVLLGLFMTSTLVKMIMKFHQNFGEIAKFL